MDFDSPYRQISFKELNPYYPPDRCVGYAPSRGRKCRMPIGQQRSRPAGTIITQLAATDDLVFAEEKLSELAPLCLCTNFHQSQVRIVVSTWLEEIACTIRHRTSAVAAIGAAQSSPFGSSFSSLGSTPSQSVVSTPATTPGETPGHEDRGTSGLIDELRRRAQTLQSELRISQRTVADLQQENADRNALHSQVGTLRREARQARRDLTDVQDVAQSRADEIAQLQDVGTLHRAQISDLSQTLDVARDDVKIERTRVTELEVKVESQTEVILATQNGKVEMQVETTKLSQRIVKMGKERQGLLEQAQRELETKEKLQARLCLESEARAMSDQKVLELQSKTSELQSHITIDEAQHQEQVSKEREAKIVLGDHRLRWDRYNARWARFNLAIASYKASRSCFATPIRILPGCLHSDEGEEDQLAELIPWPTASGTSDDTSPEAIQIFLINSLPGLLGEVNSQQLDISIAFLKLEEMRWRAPLPRLVFVDHDTKKSFEIIRSVVSGLLSDVQKQSEKPRAVSVELDRPGDP